MRLVIVSGLSGSGKSVALHMLEDLDYYCVDNIPAGLLPMFISHTVRSRESTYGYTAVGVDARNRPAEIASVPKLVADLKRSGVACEVLFLRADQEVLLKRYSETRRRHPLSRDGLGLADAISQEQALLEPIADAADLIIDTTRTSVHELRELIRDRVGARVEGRMSILFESFAFRHGVPGDADFVFDVRSLPNPHWEPGLARFTGRDPAVVEYLERHPQVTKMFDGHRRLPGALDSRAGTHQSQLPDHRHRLYRRPASLGVSCGAFGATFLGKISAGPRAPSSRRRPPRQLITSRAANLNSPTLAT